jgi:hypothetical protein
MKKSLKYQLSKSLGGNMDLNKKALRLKKSWDEVQSIIGKGKSSK